MSVLALQDIGGRRAAVWSRRYEALVLAACAAFMFVDLRTPPIFLWDESRMAVNALEMYVTGHLGLVATYGFQPDLWNTKPPLLIWLMDICMSVFGPSEWSLRLPSAVAAVGTVALVMSFTRRVTHSFKAGALAAVLLTLSLLFFGEHGARTGDYEALLAFLTTAYLYVLFFCLHRRRPAVGAVLLAGGLVALACLAKGVAGLVPGVGVPVYLLIVRRWGRPLGAPYVAAAVLVVVTVAGFLVLREHAAPGYLHAMVFNDVSGRFNATLDRHSGPPWYYLEDLFADGAFSAGLLAALSPLALVGARGPARLGLLYSLCVAGGVVAVLSLSATKLNHYGVTACPALAVATAIAAKRALDATRAAARAGRASAVAPRVLYALLAVAVALIAARSAYARFVWMPSRHLDPQGGYGALFANLSGEGAGAVTVLDGGVMHPGVAADGVPHDYAPQLDFYSLLARTRGLAVTRIAPAALAAQPAGALLASCDPDLAARLRGIGPQVTAAAGCVAVRRR